MQARDDRLKFLTDLLSSVRLVKMSAWEGPYEQKLNQAREFELAPLYGLNLLDGLLDSLYGATSSVVSGSDLSAIAEYDLKSPIVSQCI